MAYPESLFHRFQTCLFLWIAAAGVVPYHPVFSQTGEIVTATGNQQKLEVRVSLTTLEALKRQKSAAEMNQLFRVQLISNPKINVLGATEFVELERKFIFRPRFPFSAQTQIAVFIGPANDPIASTKFVVPGTPASQESRLSLIFPSANALPANLLKFYLHFSSPMQQGGIYKYFSIVEKNSGKKIELPFLELEQELWSRDQLRLTLFFDPGRIKRGLKPREEMGNIFESGKSYEFRVSGKWKNQHGIPLGNDIVKTFMILREDHQTPRISQWKLHIPRAGTLDVLSIDFDESLDSALAERVLSVTYLGQEIEMKKIALMNHEKTIGMVPANSWRPGAYLIKVGNEIEDLCGNRIGKPFDVDLKRKTESPVRENYAIPFQITAAESK